MDIAILYVCTGKYDVFWKDFYLSSEKYFLKDMNKTYFVFTDADKIFDEDKLSVKKIYQKNLGWPGNTLFRYQIFKKIVAELMYFDYVFFLNANMQFMEVVGPEILSGREELLVVQHPGYFNVTNKQFPYERNANSLAYIAEGSGCVYICGGFNGGGRESFIKMINDICEYTEQDYSRNIVARWHDESHINKYILTHAYKLLSPSYAYPEGWKLPFPCKVMIRDKVKYGGHDFLRDIHVPIFVQCFRKMKNIVKRLLGRNH